MHYGVAQRVGFEINQQMVMVGHQAVGNDVNEFWLAVFTQALDEEGPVFIMEEDGLAVDASVVEMVVVFGFEFYFSHCNYSHLPRNQVFCLVIRVSYETGSQA